MQFGFLKRKNEGVNPFKGICDCHTQPGSAGSLLTIITVLFRAYCCAHFAGRKTGVERVRDRVQGTGLLAETSLSARDNRLRSVSSPSSQQRA